MSDDFKKNRGKDDIDSFFEEFEQLNKDIKNKKNTASQNEKGKKTKMDMEKTVIANRSQRLSNSRQINKPEEPLNDVNELFNMSDIGGPKSQGSKNKRPDNSGNRNNGEPKKMSPRKTKSGNIEPNRSKSRSKRKSKNKKIKKERPWLRRIFAAAGICMVAGIVMVAFILQDTQKIDWDNIYDYLSESSILYDDKGKEIDSIYTGEGTREIVEYENMPENLINAFISVEDKTFWDHHGFNFIRMVGAVKDALFNSDQIGGTSTITQQLARNIWLTESKQERSLTRKIKEAYYAIQLERHLSKEEIIEAYLNTIALGQNALGVQAASEAYFSKDVEDLKLLECAALASLPKAPGKYSYIQTVANGEVSDDNPNIIKKSDINTYLYNDKAESRVDLILNFMEEQEYITSDKRNKASVKKLKNKVKPKIDENNEEAQFFVDYTIKNLTKDIMKELNYTEKEATQMVYSGGLKIHTTLNRKMQEAMEEEFSHNYNFPGVTNLNTDEYGNIKSQGGSIMLYRYDNFFDEGNFDISKDQFKVLDNGDILLKKKKNLSFFETTSNVGNDVNVEFFPMYTQEEGVFYSIGGGVINIPAKFKKLDDKGNLIISKDFLTDDSFTKDGKKFMKITKNNIKIPSYSYSLRQKVQQPQASMVIMNHKNGQIKALIGGRNIEGKMNYNRTTSPRQPGSSMKPIGAYGPALEMGAQKKKITKGESGFGTYWTAGSVIRDEEMISNGKVWPKNWYSGYRGNMTLRKCVEQSVNTTAVKVQKNIGNQNSIDFLKKLGVSTIEEDGPVNDNNPAALALGGMSKGISPLEMTAAYGAFPNKGKKVEPTTYKEVRNKDDKIVLESNPEKTKVMNSGTAFIMTDILRTTVSDGIANAAAIGSQPVGGKTGTTSDNFDAWFVGFTPKYTSALWIGNDVNIELTQGSKAASTLWSRIMSKAVEGDDRGEFPDAPSNVSQLNISGHSEYFIDGTAPSYINAPSDYSDSDQSSGNDSSSTDDSSDEDEEENNEDDNEENENDNEQPEPEPEPTPPSTSSQGINRNPLATPPSVYEQNKYSSMNELYRRFAIPISYRPYNFTYDQINNHSLKQ